MRLLHVLHDYLPLHRSGSEIYAHALVKTLLARGHDARVLCAEWESNVPTGTLIRRRWEGVEVHELVNNWDVASFDESYRPAALDSAIRRLLEELRPDVVHVHNLLNLSFELPRLARAAGAAVVATLHDFTLFCASGGQRVHVAERHVCHEIDPERCARCFRETGFYRAMENGRGGTSRLRRLLRLLGGTSSVAVDGRAIERRLAAARASADAIDWFVSPSQALADDAIRFGLDPARVEVSDYGFAPLAPLPRQPQRPNVGPLRIGFVGTPVWHKGAHVLLDALRRLPAGRFEAHVHGVLDWYPDYVRELRASAEGLPVVFHGGFGEGEVARIFASLDVLVVPSLWPENSPLVIHEAFQAGVPVVGARSGGIAGLVSDRVNGRLYAPEAADELAAALGELIEDRELLARFAANLPEVKSLERDADEWEERYRRVRSATR